MLWGIGRSIDTNEDCVLLFGPYFRILHSMGPSSPSADLVGSILEVEDNDFKQQRTTLRKGARAGPEARNGSYSQSQEEGAGKEPPLQIVWRNVLIFIYLHTAAVYGFYLCFTAAKSATLAWCKSTIGLYLMLHYESSNYNCFFGVVFSSILLVFIWRIWNYGRCASIVGSPMLQGQVATSPFCRCGANDCCPGKEK